jgi:hypothetical protein
MPAPQASCPRQLHARVLLSIGLIAASAAAAPGATPNAPKPDRNKAQIAQNYGKLPLSFEANQGQSDAQVKFLSRGNGYSLFLTDRAAVLSLSKGGNSSPHSKANKPGAASEANPTQSDTIEMQLANASPAAKVEGASPLPGTANYFVGGDPAKWHTSVPTYARVQYTGVYPGIDLVYYGNQRQLEYDFVVAPGHSPKPIQLRFAGARKLKLDPGGDLEVIAQNGQIAFHKPVLYQEKDGQRQPVEGSFRLLANNKVAFQIGPYDPSRTLVIDPTLVYSTYLGGSGNATGDNGTSIAVDANGSVYVAGATGSLNFPVTANAVENPIGSGSRLNPTVAFVSRLNASGTALIYSTYLGGSGDYVYGDQANAIAVDDYGQAYVAGYTGSSGLSSSCGASCAFPTTPGAFQQVNKAYGGNAFVTKLSADGTQLIYSTFLGGTGSTTNYSAAGDSASGIALDSQGDAFIAGTTFSTNFPVTPGAYQPTNHAKTAANSNLFVTKLNPTGSGLVYSTYLGGSGENFDVGSGADYGTAVAVDTEGNAYVAGYAHSADYPTTKGAFQTVNLADAVNTGPSHFNAVISKLNSTGTALIYSTYLGGGTNPYNGDAAFGIAVDSSFNAYVTGQASSQNFPITTGAFQTVCVQYSEYNCGFITKLNSTGTELSYSTFLGGAVPSGGRAGDYATGIAVNNQGEAFVTGTAFSLNFPTTAGAYQTVNNEEQNGGANYYSGNTFMTELNATGTAEVYSSYLGGSGSNGYGGDRGNGIAIDSEGNAYITGYTLSSNFPVTKGVFQSVNNAQVAKNYGASNAFIAKFGAATNYALIGTTTTVTTSEATQTQGDNVTFTVTVKPTSGGETPSGTVGLSIDGGPVDFLTLGGSGSATYETATLSPTKHTVSARFYGDVFFSASQGSITETIVGIPATLKAVSGASQTTVYGTPFANPLIVLVSDSLGNPVKGAQVTFASAGLTLTPKTGIATTAANGQASIPVTPTAAGTFLATATVAGLTTSVSFESLKVATAVLTVTCNNANVEYGQSLPLFTSTITGFVNGDTAAVLTGAPSCTTTARQGSAVGTYSIVGGKGTLADPNYTFLFKNGTLTITDIGKSDTPVLTPAAGTYTETKLVTLTDPIAGATIYYTVNGSIPTTSSTRYTTPLLVTASETIQAIAVAPDYSTSSVATAAYNIVTSPTALSSPATAIATPDATLNAYVNTFGLAGSYDFQYGTSSTALTSTTAKTTLSAVATQVAAAAKLTALKTKTTYYYQIVVTTAAGTSSGAILSFTTN